MVWSSDIWMAALRVAGEQVGHIRLADSNRLQPGLGHLDFVEVFRALRDIGYQGWMSMECDIRGDPVTALPATVRFLRERMRDAVE